MKLPLLIALALFPPFAKPAAADGPVYSIIRTNSGKTYVNCSVYKSYPDHVILEFENGGAKVLFSDLGPEAREMLKYDPEKEAVYIKERAEKNRKEQEAQEKLAKSRTKAAKVQAKAARYQSTTLQGGFGGYGGGYPYAESYPYAVGYTLGYSYDNAGHSSKNDYRKRSASDRYGYDNSPNSRYASTRGIGVGSIAYGHGNGCAAGASHADQVTSVGVPSPQCGTSWNAGNAHIAALRPFCGTPQLNVISRPACNIQTPFFRSPVATPAIGRVTPSIGSCAHR